MRAEGDSAMDGDGENEEGAEKEIVGGHAESVVARGDALAKYGVEGEAERTDKGDEIAEESGRGLSGIAGRGEENDAEEGDSHAEDFAERGGFEAKEDSEDRGVDGAHANDDGGVGDGGEAEAEGEADLVDGDAEETEVEENSEVAPRNSRLGESFVYGLRKAGRRRQSGLSRSMKVPARTTRMEARVVAGR